MRVDRRMGNSHPTLVSSPVATTAARGSPSTPSPASPESRDICTFWCDLRGGER